MMVFYDCNLKTDIQLFSITQLRYCLALLNYVIVEHYSTTLLFSITQLRYCLALLNYVIV